MEAKDVLIILLLVCLTFAVANVKDLLNQQLLETKNIKTILEEIYNK